MATPESVHNVPIAPDKASVFSKSDGRQTRGGKFRIAEIAKRVMQTSEHGKFGGASVLMKPFGSNVSRREPISPPPDVPPKTSTHPPDSHTHGSSSETEEGEAESNVTGEFLSQIEPDKLLDKILSLEKLARRYRDERNAAIQDCSSLQDSNALLRKERDDLREQLASLQPLLGELYADIGQLQKADEKLKAENTDLRANVTKLQSDKDSAISESGRMREECRNLQAELEDKAKTARQAKTEFDDARTKWSQSEHDIAELEDQLKKQQTLVHLVKVERDRLRPFENSYQDLQADYKDASGRLHQRSTELAGITQQYEELKTTYSSASDELKRLKMESHSTLDDCFFIRNFRDLQGDIRQWADRYFWGPEKKMFKLHYPHEQARVMTDLLVISDDVKDLLMSADSGKGRSLVCEAYLWKFIEEQIFDGRSATFSKGMYWAHNIRSELCRLEKFLRPGRDWSDSERRMFHKWKASTVKLIVGRLRHANDRKRIPVNPSTLMHLSSRVLDVLRPWMTDDERTYIQDLESIIQSAIDFDSHMNEQWSFMYTASTPVGFESRHGFPFDSTFMEAAKIDLQISARESVGIVVSPALVRAGTQGGDDYDNKWILIKSRVMPQGFSARSQRSKIGRTGGAVTQSLQRRVN
ncbi:hypothetical protein DL98DRAFT_653313 [Cadophora sp. DSE1049]|nr:hypothetical protein DL98DRAFT_653313 [Cadophora sp. DSE1049]